MRRVSRFVFGKFQRYGTTSAAYNKDYGKTFEKILVANRGEIACRIMRTAKKMGIKTVAVYSEADAHSLHVEMADEAVYVGPAPSAKSYLNIEAILAAVLETKAQAVHPGYGFLSENSKFCQVLDDHGIVFIGPSVNAMAQMGDKIQSKIIAANAGVHIIPGFNGVVKDEEHAMKIANEIGYPVMIKASAGGGGKGMRIAWNNKDVTENFKIAATESKASFGDDRLLIEKYVEEPRHVEIQVLGDLYGSIIHLPERECSIQRRNQKVIEEAPSMALDPVTRKMMGEQAVQLARKVGYSSAGTVEFLVDKDRNFYFLEMNTRLQVEHPITEYITGIDLVEQMIRVAAGQKLGIQQSDVKINGWAFESRVYAEDPKLFLPSIGRLIKYEEPLEPGNPNIRCDSGIKEGSEISIYYDPLICKLCTFGPDRKTALSNMNRALDSYVIRGVTHNVPLIREVLSQERFNEGRITTKYLSEEFPGGFTGHVLSKPEQNILSTIATFIYTKQLMSFTSAESIGEDLSVSIDAIDGELMIGVMEPGRFTIKYNDDTIKSITMTIEEDKNHFTTIPSPVLHFKVNNQPLTIQYHGSSYFGRMSLQAWGTVYNLTIKTKLERELSKHMIIREKAVSDRIIRAPMAGQIVSVNVKEGDIIRQGSEIAIIEAMKMQNVLRAPKAGKVISIKINSTGQNVAMDQALVELEFL